MIINEQQDSRDPDYELSGRRDSAKQPIKTNG